MNEIKQAFDEQGYYVARGVFDADTVAELEADFDRIVAQLQQSGESNNANWLRDERVVLHTHQVQTYSSRWMQAMLHPGFLDIASEILGPDVILHHSKLFQKPPEVGAPFPMHQDWGYFPTRKDSMIAGVIHVSSATDEMGCFRVYPGSHKLGRLQGMMGGGQNQEMTEKYPLEGSTALEAEPGDVVFFHYFTLHGSMPNTSQHTRKTVLVQLHAGDDEVEDAEGHLNSRIALRGWNSCSTRSTANVSG